MLNLTNQKISYLSFLSQNQISIRINVWETITKFLLPQSYYFQNDFPLNNNKICRNMKVIDLP